MSLSPSSLLLSCSLARARSLFLSLSPLALLSLLSLSFSPLLFFPSQDRGTGADRDMAAELPASTAPSCILRALWRALVMRQRALRSNRRGTRPGARHDLSSTHLEWQRKLHVGSSFACMHPGIGIDTCCLRSVVSAGADPRTGARV